MSKNILYTIFSIILVISSSNLVNAQGANPLAPKLDNKVIYTGPVAGYAAVSHNVNGRASVPNQDGGSICPTYANGSQSGFYFGWTFEWLLGGTTNSNSSIIGKLVYNYLPTTLETQGQELPASQSVNVVNTNVGFINEIDYSTISLEAYYKFNFGGTGLGVVAGPSLGYVLAATETARMDLLTPNNAAFNPRSQEELEADGYVRYENNNRTLIISDSEEVEGKQALRFALRAGVQYEFNFDGFLVIPHVMYNLHLGQVDDSGWSVNALQLGVDVRFAI